MFIGIFSSTSNKVSTCKLYRSRLERLPPIWGGPTPFRCCFIMKPPQIMTASVEISVSCPIVITMYYGCNSMNRLLTVRNVPLGQPLPVQLEVVLVDPHWVSRLCERPFNLPYNCARRAYPFQWFTYDFRNFSSLPLPNAPILSPPLLIRPEIRLIISKQTKRLWKISVGKNRKSNWCVHRSEGRTSFMNEHF